MPSRSCLAAPLLAVVLLLSPGCGGGRDDMGPPPPPLDGEPAVPDAEHGPSVAGDIDGDGVPDDEDNCPSVANADQRPACTYESPPALVGDVVDDGVARINWHRRRVGLGPVRADPDLNRGCELHVDYLIQLSAELGMPVLSHEEDLSKPYASEEGNQAGIDSVLSLGRGDAADAVDGWINTLYHRLPLIHPGLERVGVAYVDGVACVQYRPGTVEGTAAPFPILYPPPDIDQMDLTFTGNESPCPTVADPLGGGPCPSSATIPSIGLHGMGAISDVTATYINLDTGEPVELFDVYWHGGDSPHEMAGYVGASVALVPLPDSSLDSAGYEVTVEASLGGEPQTFTWRFRTTPEVVDATECDSLGDHHDFTTAYELDSGRVSERFCGQAQFFQILGSGSRRIEIHSDPSAVDLDMVAYREDGEEFARTAGLFEVDWLGVQGGMTVKVIGPAGSEAPYLLILE